MKLSELIYIIADNVCVYREKHAEGDAEYEDLYTGRLKDMPEELFNCEVRVIGAKKKDFIEIEIRP